MKILRIIYANETFEEPAVLEIRQNILNIQSLKVLIIGISSIIKGILRIYLHDAQHQFHGKNFRNVIFSRNILKIINLS